MIRAVSIVAGRSTRTQPVSRSRRRGAGQVTPGTWRRPIHRDRRDRRRAWFARCTVHSAGCTVYCAATSNPSILRCFTRIQGPAGKGIALLDVHPRRAARFRHGQRHAPQVPGQAAGTGALHRVTPVGVNLASPPARGRDTRATPRSCPGSCAAAFGRRACEWRSPITAMCSGPSTRTASTGSSTTSGSSGRRCSTTPRRRSPTTSLALPVDRGAPAAQPARQSAGHDHRSAAAAGQPLRPELLGPDRRRQDRLPSRRTS